MESEATIKRRAMRDKIRIAMQDPRNGGKYAIYQRIRRTGSPFKTVDRRCKYGTDPVSPQCKGLTRQAIFNRIHKMGWSIEKAVSTPLLRTVKKRKKKNGQNTRKNISNSVLAE